MFKIRYIEIRKFFISLDKLITYVIINHSNPN